MRRKIDYIVKTLNELFPNPSIPLNHSDPYTLLIAVLLSAQCTDARVNTVTEMLFKKATTPYEMRQLSLQEIEKSIQSCGLFRTKAKAIFELSSLLIEKYNGEVPSSLEELKQLPGVGHKTASVVLIQAFNTPAFPVDTHIHRLAKRWGLSNGKNVEQTERDLKRHFHKNLWAKLHLQIIYYARSFCPAKGHIVEKCPICKVCSLLT